MFMILDIYPRQSMSEDVSTLGTFYISMKKTTLKTLLSLVAMATLASISPAMAQAGKVTATDPKFDTIQSPMFGGNTGQKSWKPKDWLEAEVKFRVEMPKSYKQHFVDTVTVRWYVAADNPAGKGYVLLEKEVTHVNVPVGEDMHSSVYLSPSAIKRLTGKDRARGAISYIGGEIMVNGTSLESNKERYFSSKGKPGWWRSGGLSRYDAIPLLNKNETPFALLWWDRYAEIKAERR